MVKITTEGQFLRLWRLQNAEWQELENDAQAVKELTQAFLGDEAAGKILKASDLAQALCRQRISPLHDIAESAMLVHGTSTSGPIPEADEENPTRCYRSLLNALQQIFSHFPLRELLTWHSGGCCEEQKTALRYAFKEGLKELTTNGVLEVHLDPSSHSGQRDQGPLPIAVENLEALVDVLAEFHQEQPRVTIRLHLEDCGFGDKHLEPVLALIQLGALHRLALPKNTLTAQGLSALSKGLRNPSSSLTEVNLSHNPHLKNGLKAFIQEVADSPALYGLDLSGCGLSDEDKKEVQAELPGLFSPLSVTMEG